MKLRLAACGLAAAGIMLGLVAVLVPDAYLFAGAGAGMSSALAMGTFVFSWPAPVED